MTQRKQVSMHNTIKDALSAYRYTPGVSDDRDMVDRLAVKVQAEDAVEGIERSWRAARTRAMENLADVRAMTGGVKEGEFRP